MAESKRMKKDGKGLVGQHSLIMSKSAIIKLYDEQSAAGLNSNDRPGEKGDKHLTRQYLIRPAGP
jgi:hypothetical protein